MEGLSSEVGVKIREAIKAKLVELGCYVDDELPDYIMVMVANQKGSDDMAKDLVLFLNDKTAVFVAWLHNVLDRLKKVTQSSSKKSTTGSKSVRKVESVSSRRRESKKKSKSHKKSSGSKRSTDRSRSRHRRRQSSSSDSSVSPNKRAHSRSRSKSKRDYDPEKLLRKSISEDASQKRHDNKKSFDKGGSRTSDNSRELDAIRSRRSAMTEAMREGDHAAMKDIIKHRDQSRDNDGESNRRCSERRDRDNWRSDVERRRSDSNEQMRRSYGNHEDNRERPKSKGEHCKSQSQRDLSRTSSRHSQSNRKESHASINEDKRRAQQSSRPILPSEKRIEGQRNSEDLRLSLREKQKSLSSVSSAKDVSTTATKKALGDPDVKVDEDSMLSQELRTVQTLRVEVTNDLYKRTDASGEAENDDDDLELALMRQRALETMKKKKSSVDHKKVIIPLNDDSSSDEQENDKKATKFIVTLDGVDKQYFMNRRLQSKKEESKEEKSNEGVTEKSNVKVLNPSPKKPKPEAKVAPTVKVTTTSLKSEKTTSIGSQQSHIATNKSTITQITPILPKKETHSLPVSCKEETNATKPKRARITAPEPDKEQVQLKSTLQTTLVSPRPSWNYWSNYKRGSSYRFSHPMNNASRAQLSGQQTSRFKWTAPRLSNH